MSVKSLDYYMNLKYEIDFRKDKKSKRYLVSLPELEGCSTVADNIVDGMERIQEVKKDWIIQALEKNYTIPEPN